MKYLKFFNEECEIICIDLNLYWWNLKMKIKCESKILKIWKESVENLKIKFLKLKIDENSWIFDGNVCSFLC